ncbi:mannosyltransferase [Snuella sedimenti]|uniref:Mannosyltransferase n=1 Tax=Snuella sedimenti TaxID=2798802 RepID=A0A8J7J6E5_9FLAO|nr:mannosyltransferase [Snuella sedimenti]MBJ6369284.1 mannosyltransferase [Snuella sedimenti]
MDLNTTAFKQNKVLSIMVITSLMCYVIFAYNLARTEYTKLVILYIALFALFYKILTLLRHNTLLLTWLAFGFRGLFILAIPNLSQDFYRFIWDGRMILEGFNPYLYTVESFISNGEFPILQAQELFKGMGTLNASHFTNYPPINQLCFVIAGLFASKSILGSVVVMRLLIIAADFGTLCFGKKLLDNLNMPAHTIFWYLLNPFIIIELTGNLHYEGVMIFFLIWSLYLIHKGKWLMGGVVFALSVSVKLIPLIFLPLFYQWFLKRPKVQNSKVSKLDNSDKTITQQSLGISKLIVFYIIIGIVTLCLFIPFYSSKFVTNYAQTVGLWFQNFEFNASIYYIARAIGYWFRGWNEIAIIGKLIAITVLVFVLIMAFFKKQKTFPDLLVAMLFALTFYYFTATTVHPWYIATLLILSVFTGYKFPLVWSLAIILSYLAYANANNTENLWVIGLEYVIVYGVFIWEVFLKKQTSYKDIDHFDHN